MTSIQRGAVPIRAPVPVTTGDRLSFTLFLALAFHALLILGVTFTSQLSGPTFHTMEVTLAQQSERTPPKAADFLAQFDQQGSGTLEEKALITTTTEAEFQDTVVRETVPEMMQAAAPVTTVQSRTAVVATTAKSLFQTFEEDDKPEPQPDEALGQGKTLLQRSLEIASLEARLDKLKQIHAKRPRIKRLTSLATKASVDANYLNSWRRKIETIGNLNYPSEAKRRSIYGSLRLMVAIQPDGSLKEVALLESSGHHVLDEAAINIVKLAAPFAPFPDELRKTTDILEIIRTWQFQRNSSLKSI